MNSVSRFCIFFAAAFFALLNSKFCFAQDCIYKDTALTIDFGTKSNPKNFSLKNLSEYSPVSLRCPDDGNYTFTNELTNCFSDHWFDMPLDHTPNDVQGQMMVINAAENPSTFFSVSLGGLKANTTYEVSVWFNNIAKLDYECTNNLPSILISIFGKNSSQILKAATGDIPQSNISLWRRYAATFTTPSDVSLLTLNMNNLVSGGCGNDFAMDDINFRECYKPQPVDITETPPVKQKSIIPVKKPVSPAVVKEEKSLTKSKTVAVKIDATKTLEVKRDIKAIAFPIPEVLKKRENALIKKLDLPAGEIVIELYDNGVIDGDTVSVYDNARLIASKVGISDKAVKIQINLSAESSLHEIVMVAENLGSIPPNTSLMIVTTKGKREELFISSNEQKNAKIIIALAQ